MVVLNLWDVVGGSVAVSIVISLITYIFHQAQKRMNEKIGVNEKRLNAHAGEISNIKKNVSRLETDLIKEIGEVKITIAELPAIIIKLLKQNGFAK